MALQLLEYPLATQNQRVAALRGISAEQNVADIECKESRSAQIEQAYRQIFFHAMGYDREINLESQFRNGSITARDFVRGLLLSRRFQEGYVACNTNYRLVEQVIGRALGRPTHGESEKISWSILIGEKGFSSFIDEILNSEEYMQAFGYDAIPTQRARTLPGAPEGERPISQQLPRYDAKWRDAQWKEGLQTNNAPKTEHTPEWALKIWLILAAIGGLEATRIAIAIIGEIYSTR